MQKNLLQEIVESQQNNQLTFSEFVKEDLYTNNHYSISDYKVILYSFLKNNLTILLGERIKWIIKSQNGYIINFIISAISCFNNINVEYEFIIEPDKLVTNKNNYILEIYNGLDKLEHLIKIYDEINEQNFQQEKYCSNFLIGAMLSGGSISHPKENYHLELRCDSVNYASLLKKALARFGLEFKLINRHNKEVIYFKKSEMISDFLKAIKASNSFFMFEEIRIAKDFSNQIQRLNNLDVQNIDKSSKAGVLAKQMITKIKEKHPLYLKQNHSFHIYCEVRLDNPELSLVEIADLMLSIHNVQITKSGLNHINNKIKKMYQELE